MIAPGAEVALFWLVLAAFAWADNLVLLPSGADCLHFGRAGAMRYEPGLRWQLLRRDLVALNPLNPFGRAVVTLSPAGPLDPQAWRNAQATLAQALPTLNVLAWLGVGYMGLLGTLALASAWWPFLHILAALIAVHLATWTGALVLLLRRRVPLGLTPGRCAQAAFEALLVPAYLVHLGKRTWLRHRLSVPAVAVGMQQFAALATPDEREWMAYRMRNRLDELALGATGAEADWLQEARACLTTSAPSAGS